jgi:hypothetical protein
MSSRATEGKAYRSKKRIEMGEEAYKLEEARKRRERRAKKKSVAEKKTEKTEESAEESKETNEDVLLNNLFEEKLKISTDKGHTIKKSSVKATLTKTRNIHKRMFPDAGEMTGFEWTRDFEKVVKFIMDSSSWRTPESKQQQLQALASVLAGAGTTYQKEYEFYSKASISGRQKLTKTADNSELSNREGANIMAWSDVKKKT